MKIKDNLTKNLLSYYLSKKKGFSLKFSRKIVEDFIEILSFLFVNNKTIIKNFGTFKIIFKAERVGRNPKTNEVYTIKSRKSLSFVPAKKLIKKLNG